jgi:hypothetical protein
MGPVDHLCHKVKTPLINGVFSIGLFVNRISFNHPVPKCRYNNLRSIFASKLSQNPMDMRLYSPLGNDQFLGNLIITQTEGHFLQDFLLPIR